MPGKSKLRSTPRSLAEQIVARLGADIRGGRLAAGARLPTEQALTDELGVSRTVVREAVAALRADGLVVTRRGSGAYVADPTAGPYRIAGPSASTATTAERAESMPPLKPSTADLNPHLWR